MAENNGTTWLDKWKATWTASAPEPMLQELRIRTMERNVILPVKAVFIGILFYQLYFGNWYLGGLIDAHAAQEVAPREIALELVRHFFLIYFMINTAVGFVLVGMNQFSLQTVQWVVYANGIVDALFMSALALVVGWFDSGMFWAFLGLIVRNAAGIPLAGRQITLNLLVCLLCIIAGIVDLSITRTEHVMLTEFAKNFGSSDPFEITAEPFVLRMFLLLLMTVCCYGVQVLLDKQRRANEEAREFALRQQQLQATGRLAAEIAHQLKNPLGIINNAAYTLQKTVKEGKRITQQIQIIREEVLRSDQIITELMGYARLGEGQVEKVNVAEELDKAVLEVFPPAVKYEVTVYRDYAAALPLLLVQRGHISEAFVNILQNAREAMNGQGKIWLKTEYGQNYSVIVRIRDNGPGIDPGKADKVFEPYFTTKERGTGLGLAIVKHNVEIYGGSVRVESELGKGTEFVFNLPARTWIKLKR